MGSEMCIRDRITGEYETIESASATFKENIEQGNYNYVVHEVKDEEVA